MIGTEMEPSPFSLSISDLIKERNNFIRVVMGAQKTGFSEVDELFCNLFHKYESAIGQNTIEST